MNSSDGEGEGERGNSAIAIGGDNDEVIEEHTTGLEGPSNLGGPAFLLEKRAQAAISTAALLATAVPPAPTTTG